MVQLQKNNPQGLHNTDDCRMFAMSYILTSGHSSLKSRAFFVPVSIRGVTPSYSCNGCTACSSSVGQRVGNSLCYIVTPTNLLSVMSYTEEQGLSGNNSTVQPTSAPRKRVSHKRFTAEVDAKNCAYSFLLVHGLMDDFLRYANITRGLNHHIICMSYLFNKACEQERTSFDFTTPADKYLHTSDKSKL